jgi:hypothetical protein
MADETSLAPGQTELRQSAANLLGLPILIAVCVVGIVIRQLFVHPLSTIVLGVSAGVAILDMLLAVYLLRNMGSTLVITADDITFTRQRRKGRHPGKSSSARPAARSASAWPPTGPSAWTTPATY